MSSRSERKSVSSGRKGSPRQSKSPRGRKGSPRGSKSPRGRKGSPKKDTRKVYCGNNKNNRGLVDGSKRIGTRHECLQKGFGVGLYILPVDPEFFYEYAPIDTRKTYCGNKDILPDGYQIMGTNGACYSKGIGAGKKARFNKEFGQ